MTQTAASAIKALIQAERAAETLRRYANWRAVLNRKSREASFSL